MKYWFWKFLFILPFLLFPIKSFAVQVDIKDISDDKYFQAVHKELVGAVKKVSSMRPDNPLRNIGYVVGILRKENF